MSTDERRERLVRLAMGRWKRHPMFEDFQQEAALRYEQTLAADPEVDDPLLVRAMQCAVLDAYRQLYGRSGSAGNRRRRALRHMEQLSDRIIGKSDPGLAAVDAKNDIAAALKHAERVRQWAEEAKRAQRVRKIVPLDQIIEPHVRRAVVAAGGVEAAARALGVGRATLYRWMKQWSRRDALATARTAAPPPATARPQRSAG